MVGPGAPFRQPFSPPTLTQAKRSSVHIHCTLPSFPEYFRDKIDVARLWLKNMGYGEKERVAKTCIFPSKASILPQGKRGGFLFPL